MLKFSVALCLCRLCYQDIKRIKTDLFNFGTQWILMVWPFLHACKSPTDNIEHQLPLSGIKLLLTGHDTVPRDFYQTFHLCLLTYKLRLFTFKCHSFNSWSQANLLTKYYLSFTLTYLEPRESDFGGCSEEAESPLSNYSWPCTSSMSRKNQICPRSPWKQCATISRTCLCSCENAAVRIYKKCQCGSNITIITITITGTASNATAYLSRQEPKQCYKIHVLWAKLQSFMWFLTKCRSKAI